MKLNELTLKSKICKGRLGNTGCGRGDHMKKRWREGALEAHRVEKGSE